MTEEIEAAAAVCGGTWWSSSKSFFGGCSPPCSTVMNADVVGGFGWPCFDDLDIKAVLPSTESSSSNKETSSTNTFMSDECLAQMMGFGSSSPLTSPSCWNEAAFHGNEGTEGYGSTMQEEMNSCNLFEGLFEPTELILPNNNGSVDNNMSIELLSASWHKATPILNPQQPAGGLPFSYNGSCSDEPATVPTLHGVRANFEDNPTCRDNATKTSTERVQDLDTISDEYQTVKRRRLETPSPLPSFKVRKEKLGDRITALQQLVSPFGKTDTASVLHEAVEYIKFLHTQVTVLSTTPYMKQEAPIQQQISDKPRDHECPERNLRSRGLCLVPVTSTIPIANEITAGFWTPSFDVPLR